MNRRLLSVCCFFLCLALFLPTALCEQLPGRDRFSLAYDRLTRSVSMGRSVGFSVNIQPTGGDGGVQDAFLRMMGEMELSGLIQCFLDGGGWLSASAAVSGQEIASVEQLERDGRICLRFGDEWISIAEGEEAQGMALLTMDAFGQALISFDYGGIRKGSVPFVTPIVGNSMRLWELASPWSEDNNYLSAASGSTSHGTTYKIDTYGFRTILTEWAEGLSRDGLSIGIPGTELQIGLDEEAFEGFRARILSLAASAELSRSIKINMAFGEGDMLSTANGSGTVKTPEGSRDISYTYKASVSKTKITQQYKLNFQPKGADTMVLSMRITTSGNGKQSGQKSISATASGQFDGKPYEFTLESKMTNEFTLAGGKLAEAIHGTASCKLVYDGETIADIRLTRQSDADSYSDRNALAIVDRLDLTITNDRETLFSGIVTLSFDISDQPPQPPSAENAQPVEWMDFMEIETARATLQTVLSSAQESIVSVLTNGLQEYVSGS